MDKLSTDKKYMLGEQQSVLGHSHTNQSFLVVSISFFLICALFFGVNIYDICIMEPEIDVLYVVVFCVRVLFFILSVVMLPIAFFKFFNKIFICQNGLILKINRKETVLLADEIINIDFKAFYSRKKPLIINCHKKHYNIQGAYFDDINKLVDFSVAHKLDFNRKKV